MKHSKSGIFLMELIISILFFALASAVCIQLFVKAHLLGAETAQQNKSILWCQNLAELYTACDGRTEEIYEYLLAGNTLSKDNVSICPREADFQGIVIYFDQDFLPCTQNSPQLSYTAVLSCKESADGLLQADISVCHAERGGTAASYLQSSASLDSSVYRLHLKHHIAFTLEDMEDIFYEETE